MAEERVSGRLGRGRRERETECIHMGKKMENICKVLISLLQVILLGTWNGLLYNFSLFNIYSFYNSKKIEKLLLIKSLQWIKVLIHLTQFILQPVEKGQHLPNPKFSRAATGTKQDLDLVSTDVFSKGKLRAYRSIKSICLSPSFSVHHGSLPASRAGGYSEGIHMGGHLNKETPGLRVSWIWLSQGFFFFFFPGQTGESQKGTGLFPSSCSGFEWSLTTLVCTVNKIFDLKKYSV